MKNVRCRQCARKEIRNSDFMNTPDKPVYCVSATSVRYGERVDPDRPRQCQGFGRRMRKKDG